MSRNDPGTLRSALAHALEAVRQPPAQPTPPTAPAAPPAPRPARAARRALTHTATLLARSVRPSGAGTSNVRVAASTSARPPRNKRAPAPRPASTRLDGLHELGQVAQQWREAQAQTQAEAQKRREAAARQEAERQWFSRAVGPVTPLHQRNHVHLQQPPPEPLPLQLWLDEERVLQESISDDLDVSTLLDTDDQLSFRRPGIGVEITRRLRAGHWSIQRQLDLHGLRTDEAREALGEFIRQAHRNGLRCLRVIHGKGLGSPGKSPVLKGRVQGWLVQKKEVLAFVQARPVQGGAGALLVLLVPAGHAQTASANESP
ncbi:hypothetical protein GCM10027395_17530 [Giesbergeria sinuosa]